MPVVGWCSTSRLATSVSDEALMHGVVDAALEGAPRSVADFPFGLLAQVGGATGRVVADLGDSGHVHGVVQHSWCTCRVSGRDDGSRRGVGGAAGGLVRGAHRQHEHRRGESADDDEPPDAVEDVEGRCRRCPRKAMVRATPNVPPNWRTAWATAPPTPCGSGRQGLGDDAGELREDAGDAEAAEHHRREVVAQVVDVGAEHHQAVQAAAGVEDAAGDEDRTLPDAAGELAGAGRDEADHRSDPGATPKPAWSIDHPHTWVRKRIEPKNSAANAVPNTSMATFAHRKLGMRNRSRSSAGAFGASLVGDEHGEDDESGAEDAERAGAEPPEVLGSDDAVGQQRRPRRRRGRRRGATGSGSRGRTTRAGRDARRRPCRCRPAG